MLHYFVDNPCVAGDSIIVVWQSGIYYCTKCNKTVLIIHSSQQIILYDIISKKYKYERTDVFVFLCIYLSVKEELYFQALQYKIKHTCLRKGLHTPCLYTTSYGKFKCD